MAWEFAAVELRELEQAAVRASERIVFFRILVVRGFARKRFVWAIEQNF